MILKKLKDLSLKMQLLIQSMPRIELLEITPKYAATAEGAQKYLSILNALRIPPPIVQILNDAVADDEPKFHWAWTAGRSEYSGYRPLCEFLRHNGLSSMVVQGGKQLPLGSLFCYSRTVLWSLVSVLHESGRMEKIIHQIRIAGRTDLVCLDMMTEGEILPFMVRFAIEVRMSKYLENPSLFEAAIRESVVQLFGLCENNDICTPCVLLTDLNDKHFVIALELPNPRVQQYKISAKQCTSLWNAIRLANEVAQKAPVSRFFGRRPF
jgi:hypothetical protein